jgi:hypothetical protein
MLTDWSWVEKARVEPEGLPLFELQRPEDGSSYHLYHNQQFVAVASCLEQIGDGLDSWFHNLLAEHSPRLFVHAGVVEWLGKLLVFPARSFSGKSTLINALCAAGARYYSDEFAVMDPGSGLIAAFPRRLSLRPSGRIEPQVLGWKPELGARLPDFIFDLEFLADCPGLEVQSVSRGAAALRLFENTVAAQRFGADALAAFQKALGNCRCFSGVRGEAELAAQELFSLVQSTSR